MALTKCHHTILSFIMLDIKFWQQLLKGPWGHTQALQGNPANPKPCLEDARSQFFSAFVKAQLLKLVFIR